MITTETSRNAPDLSGTGLYREGGLLRLDALASYPELLHGISTRHAPDGDDWNLSARRGSPQHPPHPTTALRNREKLAALLGVTLDSMVACHQVHGTQVAPITAVEAGRGTRPDTPSMDDADAMVTNTPGITMVVLSADCPPVFLYDPARRVIGLAHSGWKGTVGRIAGRVVDTMVNDHGCEPRHIVAVVGPSIGPCCYIVGEDVIEAAQASFPGAWEGDTPVLQRRSEHTYFNLPEGIRRALIDADLQPHNIAVVQACTAHNRHLFYSHRGDAGQCGLFGAALGMRVE
jgi:YfiH family protein